MLKGLIGISILASVFYLAKGVQAATFNVTTPAAFQTSLTTAQSNGQDDTINVAAGTYAILSTLTYETVENFGLTIAGAGAASAILDGGNSVQIMSLSSEGNGDISISGLTFNRGRMSDIAGFGAALFVLSNSSGSITVDQCVAKNCTAIRNTAGAWLGAVHGDITVTNSSFTHNSCDDGTSDDGCGLYLYFDGGAATGDAILRNNNISYNTLNTNPSPVGNCDGAGLMIYHLGTSGTAPSITLEDNTINNNLSYEGAGGASLHVLHQKAKVSLLGNTFSGNTVGPLPSGVPIQIYGGGAHVYLDGGDVTLINNQFLNNRNLDPFGIGAGLCLDNLPTGTLLMTGNVFAGNQNAGMGGGAVVNPGDGVTIAIIANNLFVNNQAGVGESEGSAGGISISSGTHVNLINNTFYNNTADDAGGMSFYAEATEDIASLYNEVYWGNTPNSISVFSAGPVQATYSNIDGGSGESYFGTGCIDADPLFFDVSNPPGEDGFYATLDDGLHLTVGSPSMNKGSNAAVPLAISTDISGQTRIQGGTVDMGAYEGVAGTPTTYHLTMAVSPSGSGTTTPSVGTHEVSAPQAVTATATAGYSFVKWTTSGNASIIDSASLSTSVTLTGDAIVTANFEGTSPLVFVTLTGECADNTPCYHSIQNAINAATTGSIILITGGTYNGPFALNQAKSLTLQGGWDSSFSSQTENTILKEAPNVRQGSLTMQELNISP